MQRDEQRSTPLHAAVVEGTSGEVRRALASGVHPDARDGSGATPLLLAVRAGNVAAARALLAGGASVRLSDRYGRTPAWTAAAYADATMLRLLSDNGAPSGTAVPDLRVLAAVQRRDHEGLVRLLEEGAPVEEAGPDARRALQIACEQGDPEATALLVRSGASPVRTDEDHATPAHRAIPAGHTGVLALVCPDEVLVIRDSEGRTPLHLAVWTRDSRVLSSLCETAPEGVRRSLEIPDADGWTALTVADHLGSRALAERLIDLGADPDVARLHGGTSLHRAVLSDARLDPRRAAELRDRTDCFGRTATHVAATLGHERPLQDLIALGADPEARDARGRTPLHSAAAGDRVDCVDVLLDAGAHTHARDERGRTPAHDAAASGAGGALSAMGERAGPELTALTDDAGRAPLLDAVAARSPAAVGALLDAGACPAPHGAPDGPLSLATANGDEDLVGALIHAVLSRDPDAADPPREVCGRALRWVGTRGDLASRLMHAGADCDVQDGEGRTALMHACRAGATDVVRILLTAGADPDLRDVRGWAALTHADVEGHEGIVELLVAAGARTRETRLGGTPLRSLHGRTRLHFGVLRGDLDRIDDTLGSAGHGIVDAADHEGRTALHLSADLSATACLERLLDAGADAGLQDLHGITPLHLVCWHPTPGRSRRLEALLSAGTDARVANALGETALHYLARFGSAAEVEMLLAAGAAPDAPGFTGGRPLAEAASAWNGPVVRLLLDRGCDPGAEDEDGATALDLAVQERAIEAELLPVVQLLLEAGADPARPGPLGTPLERARSGRLPLLVEMLAGA